MRSMTLFISGMGQGAPPIAPVRRLDAVECDLAPADHAEECGLVGLGAPHDVDDREVVREQHVERRTIGGDQGVKERVVGCHGVSVTVHAGHGTRSGS